MINLSGKTVFITGASRGIGEAAARKAASYGANVVLAARSNKDIERIAAEIGNKALALTCDVSDYDSIKEAIDSAVQHFGGLDVVVNNAGVIDPIDRIEDTCPDAWGSVIDINIKGVYHCMHAAYPALLEAADGGRSVIINMSSGAAHGALEGWAHYSASKAAVASLTRSANREWNEKGISVIGLSPGTVATDMMMSIKKSGINAVSQIDWETHISPDWVGEAICWLTTDEAREFDGTDFTIKTDEGRKLVGLI
ncbi:SDR family oxidoreductase [Lentilitoribacter sp. Alg239-R112]|uniref:SDR family oxidoreductase n=1 Tax=Lentilitoribacter sp. Alg239-R112 TaxID=2305987 RepID=UPI0013A696E9|nr:SDR family oxidoreductase [Lentilitoribacter sp. Alg239-R112]